MIRKDIEVRLFVMPPAGHTRCIQTRGAGDMCRPCDVLVSEKVAARQVQQ